jgi:hypothetical protein
MLKMGVAKSHSYLPLSFSSSLLLCLPHLSECQSMGEALFSYQKSLLAVII